MEKYDQLMGDKPVIPLNDYKHRAIVKHYMIRNVIKPLQTVKGLYLEELGKLLMEDLESLVDSIFQKLL